MDALSADDQARDDGDGEDAVGENTRPGGATPTGEGSGAAGRVAADTDEPGLFSAAGTGQLDGFEGTETLRSFFAGEAGSVGIAGSTHAGAQSAEAEGSVGNATPLDDADTGMDAATGDIGADTFVIGGPAGAEVATVTDFTPGEDRLAISYARPVSDLTIDLQPYTARVDGAEVTGTEVAVETPEDGLVPMLRLQGVAPDEVDEDDFVLTEAAETASAAVPGRDAA